MSFKSVQKKIAAKGVGMERAGAMLASRTRKTMEQHGLSTKHGIPKGVFNKAAFKKKVNIPGMSEHTMVNCSQPMRKQTMSMEESMR